jgi:hypothetical protein
MVERDLPGNPMNARAAEEVPEGVNRIRSVAAEWYAQNPDVLRLWLYESVDSPAADVSVVLAIAPTCDGNEVAPIWLARCHDWQRQLEVRLSKTVHLDWFNAELEPVPSGELEAPTRVCLASVAWRYIG